MTLSELRIQIAAWMSKARVADDSLPADDITEAINQTYEEVARASKCFVADRLITAVSGVSAYSWDSDMSAIQEVSYGGLKSITLSGSTMATSDNIVIYTVTTPAVGFTANIGDVVSITGFATNLTHNVSSTVIVATTVTTGTSTFSCFVPGSTSTANAGAGAAKVYDATTPKTRLKMWSPPRLRAWSPSWRNASSVATPSVAYVPSSKSIGVFPPPLVASAGTRAIWVYANIVPSSLSLGGAIQLLVADTDEPAFDSAYHIILAHGATARLCSMQDATSEMAQNRKVEAEANYNALLLGLKAYSATAAGLVP